ncbi:MAG: DegV family protein [Lachnospiraceae bacterium]|nr:DegV family protein [Lachnospiraceae bacterium]
MVRILADSTCDLSKELTERYNITIIPLYVRLGEDEYLDGINITPAELYKWSDEHGQTPKTAAPGIEDISKLLDPAGSDEYVIFTISSSMSASFNNARLAAENMEMSDRVHVIDSENLSTGIGLQVIRAAELAAEGKSAAEIVSEIESIKGKVRASFVIDTLVYLHRGGRCSGLAALFGSVLKLHPRIAVTDGAMHPEQKYRGSSRKYVLEYVKDMEPELKKARKDRVFITHSPCDRAVIESVRAYLESLGHFDEILETDAGSVIASHCGPGTLGVLFIAE